MPESPIYEDYIARCRAVLGELSGDGRADAEHVLRLAAARDAAASSAADAGGDGASVRRELLGLIERLGRRASAGVPFASLARALSADLHGAVTVRAESLAACDRALQMRGL